MTTPQIKIPLPLPHATNGATNGGGEVAEAQAAAQRYRCEFVDLRDGAIEHDLFRSIPVDLMFRYNFVPLKAQNGTLEIALSDPRNLNTIDELGLLLHKKLHVKVATASQIADLLKKTEQSQRVLEEVTEGFALDVVGDEDNPEETLSIDRLASVDSDIAPVIKLVDTTIFNALERRASDIHIESRDRNGLGYLTRFDTRVSGWLSPPTLRRRKLLRTTSGIAEPAKSRCAGDTE
jgi:type IV pilus assembly protein PilB